MAFFWDFTMFSISMIRPEKTLKFHDISWFSMTEDLNYLCKLWLCTTMFIDNLLNKWMFSLCCAYVLPHAERCKRPLRTTGKDKKVLYTHLHQLLFSSTKVNLLCQHEQWDHFYFHFQHTSYIPAFTIATHHKVDMPGNLQCFREVKLRHLQQNNASNASDKYLFTVIAGGFSRHTSLLLTRYLVYSVFQRSNCVHFK